MAVRLAALICLGFDPLPLRRPWLTWRLPGGVAAAVRVSLFSFTHTGEQTLSHKTVRKMLWNPRQASYPLSEEDIRGLLKRFDTDGNGKLSKKELKVAFQSLGLRLSGWRAGRAVRRTDTDGDGQISEDEMLELAKYCATKWGFSIK
ncbi:hypothetical protein RJ639_037455 [Escallonia herrerae]|uniref:EF-hand domain-containing protein n=1 Tax=Escallonia herrerae TaxID=1293975 RepID=A0AA88WJJ0_9ASTE|nr:hypothetical protein RJ639_037455 [Escallonia herrerae]